jgi:hypothetical protein
MNGDVTEVVAVVMVRVKVGAGGTGKGGGSGGGGVRCDCFHVSRTHRLNMKAASRDNGGARIATVCAWWCGGGGGDVTVVCLCLCECMY